MNGAWSYLEFAAGAALAIATLLDVFATILVPGPARGVLRVLPHTRALVMPVSRRVHARNRHRPGSRPSNSFGPLIMLLAFATWMVLLMFAFGAMYHANATLFIPELHDFSQALYVAGSSLATLGVSEVDANSYARWLILAAAISGFAVITATLTYLMQIQSSLHQRESAVLQLCGSIGRPASGIALLETMAALGLRNQLPALFTEWRGWSAATLHSHLSYPVLAYFHSVDAESDWVAMLEAVLDAATLVAAYTEDEAHGTAILMHRGGARTAAKLCDLFRLDTDNRAEVDDATLGSLVARLQAAGYPMAPDLTAATQRFRDLRCDYAARLNALAEHLGADRAQLR